MYVYETKNTQFGGPVLLNFGPFQKFQRETRASCAYSVIRALCKELCYSEIYFFYSFFKLLRMWIFFKPGCEKWWKIVCHLSIGSKLPEFALPISKLRLQCSETITSASLDNVAYREKTEAEWQSWMQEWHDVIFSDKSSFYIQYSNGRIRVWRLPRVAHCLFAFDNGIRALNEVWYLSQPLDWLHISCTDRQ